MFVGVAVAVFVGVAVAVFVGVAVGVFVGVLVGVLVGEAVSVAVAVGLISARMLTLLSWPEVLMWNDDPPISNTPLAGPQYEPSAR